MLIRFFLMLRQAGLPVGLTEFLALQEALKSGLADYSVDEFYALGRTILVKDERHYDRYDRVFAAHFQGLQDAFEALFGKEIPAEWLKRQAELSLSEEERRKIEAMGGFEALMKALKERLAEQKGRHQGGNKMIGTAGRSPFGAYGYNPEGVRIGQDDSRHRRAVKVWDRREFRNLDEGAELGARNGGMLDLKLQPERHNAVKVLLFLDVGGSMDDHVKVCQELFAAARTEFKHLEYYYFHNFVYETVWKDNRRRHAERIPTTQVMRTYGPDYRLVFVGDATMSPYEIVQPGGSVEHWNEEAGSVWMQRLRQAYPKNVWLNPEPEDRWAWVPSVKIARELLEDRMYPLTLEGIDRAMRALNAK